MADDGSITLPERLERIEHMLGSIDAKLDAKADASLVQSVTERISAIERQGTSQAQHAEKTATEVRDDLNKIKLKLASFAGGLAVASFLLQIALSKGWM